MYIIMNSRYYLCRYYYFPIPFSFIQCWMTVRFVCRMPKVVILIPSVVVTRAIVPPYVVAAEVVRERVCYPACDYCHSIYSQPDKATSELFLSSTDTPLEKVQGLCLLGRHRQETTFDAVAGVQEPLMLQESVNNLILLRGIQYQRHEHIGYQCSKWQNCLTPMFLLL